MGPLYGTLELFPFGIPGVPETGFWGKKNFDFLIQIHAVLLRKIISCGVCLGYPSMILLRPIPPLSFSSMVSRGEGVVWNLALKNWSVLLPFPLFVGKCRVHGNTLF